MKTFKVLDWDSMFFGFTVARILPNTLDLQNLDKILISMRQENITLAYWATNPDDEESKTAAQQCNGFLADRKVTYLIDAHEMQQRINLVSSEAIVEEYTEIFPTWELEDLSVQAGIYSRFKVDPRMPEGLFVKLYKLWIYKSVTRELADKVFVVRDAGKIVAIVTVGEKDGRGDIGLIAVDSSVRGRKFGVTLVNTAQNWALEKGFSFAQVVTQGENIAACRFYEKCGYRIEKIENIYHFWSRA